MEASQKRFKVIVWGGWYGSNNVGDQALLLSITDLIGEINDNVEFVVFTTRPEHLLFYTKRDSSRKFSAIKMRSQFLQLVRSFKTANLFIFGGGVPIYDEVSHSLAIILLVTLSKIFGVPYLFWSVSSLPLKYTLTRAVLRYILPGALLITVRDKHTAQLFTECGVKEGGLQIVPDSAFTLRSGRGENAIGLITRAGFIPDQGRPLVALTPRLLRDADGEAHTHYTPQSTDENQKEVDAYSAVLDWLWENGYQPIFVPMNVVPLDSDVESARLIIKSSRYGDKALLISEEIFPRDAANVYRHCQAAFVTRVHGSITAFLGGCPAAMYAFNLKHVGIMEQMKMSRYIFDPALHTATDAVDLMSQILRSRTELISQMKETHLALSEQARTPLEVISTILNE